MADDIKKPEDEIAALKARVEELERANKPPKPFVPEPYQRYDPTAGMSMPRSALEAMIAAEPRGFMQGVVGDNRAPSGRAGAIPDSQQVSNVRGAGGPVGWQHDIPIGPPPGVNCCVQSVRDGAADVVGPNLGSKPDHRPGNC